MDDSKRKEEKSDTGTKSLISGLNTSFNTFSARLEQLIDNFPKSVKVETVTSPTVTKSMPELTQLSEGLKEIGELNISIKQLKDELSKNTSSIGTSTKTEQNVVYQKKEEKEKKEVNWEEVIRTRIQGSQPLKESIEGMKTAVRKNNEISRFSAMSEAQQSSFISVLSTEQMLASSKEISKFGRALSPDEKGRVQELMSTKSGAEASEALAELLKEFKSASVQAKKVSDNMREAGISIAGGMVGGVIGAYASYGASTFLSPLTSGVSKAQREFELDQNVAEVIGSVIGGGLGFFAGPLGGLLGAMGGGAIGNQIGGLVGAMINTSSGSQMERMVTATGANGLLGANLTSVFGKDFAGANDAMQAIRSTTGSPDVSSSEFVANMTDKGILKLAEQMNMRGANSAQIIAMQVRMGEMAKNVGQGGFGKGAMLGVQGMGFTAGEYMNQAQSLMLAPEVVAGGDLNDLTKRVLARRQTSPYGASRLTNYENMGSLSKLRSDAFSQALFGMGTRDLVSGERSEEAKANLNRQGLSLGILKDILPEQYKNFAGGLGDADTKAQAEQAMADNLKDANKALADNTNALNKNTEAQLKKQISDKTKYVHGAGKQR